MSEEQTLPEELTDAIEETNEVQETEEVVQEDVQESSPEGYMSRDEWEAAGKNPDDWRSEKTFNDFKNITEANKRLHQQIDHLKTSHDESMQNLSHLHSVQLQRQQNELAKKYNEAVEDADVEEVNRINQEQWELYNQQQQLNSYAIQQQQQHEKEVTDWYNGLIAAFPDKQKEIDKEIAYSLQKNPGNVALVANEVENFVRSFTPTKNPRRSEPTAVAGKSGGKSSGAKLTMRDVTDEEKSARPFFKTEKAFLNAVANDRKYGAKNK